MTCSPAAETGESNAVHLQMASAVAGQLTVVVIGQLTTSVTPFCDIFGHSASNFRILLPAIGCSKSSLMTSKCAAFAGLSEMRVTCDIQGNLLMAMCGNMAKVR